MGDTLKRFQPDAQVPYEYNGKLYALPDTQTFYMLFYRTDILENLGLTIPKNWDEFLYTSAIIQRNNMNIYVPYTMITSSQTISTGIGSLNMFATLMGQKGLSLYNKELNATSLTGIEQISVFDFWTKFYTDYHIFNALQRSSRNKGALVDSLRSGNSRRERFGCRRRHGLLNNRKIQK